MKSGLGGYGVWIKDPTRVLRSVPNIPTSSKWDLIIEFLINQYLDKNGIDRDYFWKLKKSEVDEDSKIAETLLDKDTLKLLNTPF